MSVAPHLDAGPTRDMYLHEPQFFTQDEDVAGSYFPQNGETLFLDTTFLGQFQGHGAGTAAQAAPLQTSPEEYRTRSNVVSPLAPQHTQSHAISSPSLQQRQSDALSPGLKRAGSELLPVDNNNALSRSTSKRSRQERLERQEDFYACTWPGCSHRSSLMCEVRKHFQAKHTPEQARPHGCPHCDKRFMWPKDVRRHLKQKHKDLTENTAALPPALSHDDSVESDETVVTPPLEPKKRNKKLGISSIGGIIMALNRLSLGSSKDTDHEDREKRYVMVAQESSSSIWHKVHLDGVHTSEGLLNKMVDTLYRHEPRQPSKFLMYSHGSGKSGKRLPEKQLLHAVSKATAAHRTLEIVLAPVISPGNEKSGH